MLVMKRTRANLEEDAFTMGLDPPRFFDAWYMDDGQIVCSPADVDRILKHLDHELARVGGNTWKWR